VQLPLVVLLELGGAQAESLIGDVVRAKDLVQTKAQTSDLV
jgi:hypothetical protein